LTGKTKVDFGHGEAKFITYLNIFNNAIADPEQLESVEIDPKQNEVKYGDIFFTTSSETPEEVGMSSIWLQNQANVYLNSFCFGYRPQIAIDPYFMAFNLRSESVRKKFIFLAQGISRYNISKNKVMEMEINLPCLSEQKKIGEFFFKLDNLITLHQRKCDSLVKLKKALLQKMFPKNGESVPEVRFPGFTEPWEQRKFLDCIKKITDFRGRTPKKLGMDWSESGYLALSALNVKNGYIDKTNDVHYGNQELYERWMLGNELHKGQVLFTTEAPMGNVAQVPDNEKYILSQRTIAFDVKNDLISEDFLAVILRTPNVFEMLTALSSGGTAKGVSQKSLSYAEFTIPSNLKEQEKIATFFLGLGNLITLHQRKVQALQKLKKALLQQMFV